MASPTSRPTQALLPQFSSLVASFLPMHYLQPLCSFVNQLFSSPTTHRSLLGSLILTLLFGLSVLISVIAYVSFYWAYVPQMGLKIPLWLQYGDGRVPHAIVNFGNVAHQIAVDQAYDVKLRLTVPANDRNFDLGNFMVRLNLMTASPHNTTLHRVSRHSTLAYQPKFARNLHALKYIRTLFLLSSPQVVQHLEVSLLRETIIQASSLGKRGRLGLAQVEVGRNDIYDSTASLVDRRGWGELQVYDATLEFDAHLVGLRAMMYYHPYVAFIIFCSLFMMAEFASIICTWGLMVVRRHQTNPSPYMHVKTEQPDQSLGPSSLSSSESTRLPPDTKEDTTENTLSSVSRQGMTEIDEIAAPDEEHRAIDDEITSDLQEKAQRFALKPEDPDADEFVGGSETTGASIARSLGSRLTDRSSSRTSSSSGS